MYTHMNILAVCTYATLHNRYEQLYKETSSSLAGLRDICTFPYSLIHNDFSDGHFGKNLIFHFWLNATWIW